MHKGSLARRLVVAGAAVWFVRWLASPPELSPEPAHEAESKPARDDWEFPQPRLAPVQLKRMSRRFATTLAFTAIFFAGAALAAGAGNEVAKLSSESAAGAAPAAPATTTADATATTVAATPTDPATAPTDAAPTTADATTPVAQAAPPAPAPDPAPTDQSQPQPDGSPDSTPAPSEATPPPVATTDATATDGAPSSPTDATTTDATATDPTDSPQPVPPTDQSPADTPAPAVISAGPVGTPTASKPRPAARPKRHTTVHKPAQTRTHTQARQLENLPLVVPYHALVFNPQAWLNDNPGTPTGQAAVALAMNYLGVPYRWGGAVPATGFDCSGLVRFVYAQLGINLVHYAASQFAAFPKLDPAQLAPGDLVFFEPKADGPGHVAMYIGHDEMIEAPHTGAVVRISSFSGAAAAMGFLGAVRPYAAPAPSLVLMSQVDWGPAPSLFRLQ